MAAAAAAATTNITAILVAVTATSFASISNDINTSCANPSSFFYILLLWFFNKYSPLTFDKQWRIIHPRILEFTAILHIDRLRKRANTAMKYKTNITCCTEKEELLWVTVIF